ncbi:SAM-dependent methyltransferase [Streptacidiphilus sp. MAP12-33]|uniref:class I SAM-dependent methyltransferase n=1 Tax=Streptacidiphilus sp. MAP12-33 TaxID=3156266 RepID=UPI003512D816
MGQGSAGQERALVFGTTAEQYDAARPGYSALLVDTVLDYVGNASPRALEIGAGTGKATVAFAGRGLPVLAVEPDPRMAEVLRRNTTALPQVDVEVGLFEQWQRAERRFDLLYAAQAWHWLDPETRRDHTFDALVPGGTVALFWNFAPMVDPVLHREFTAIDADYGTELGRLTGLATEFEGEIEATEENGWPSVDFAGDPRFTDQRSVRVRNGRTRHDADAWLSRVATQSGVQILEPERRATLLAALRRVLDTHGAGLDTEWITDVFLARRLPEQTQA